MSYNENVDVTKSHLTIRSEHGPSVTTVSASLDPNKHVFKITDQTNVTLKGFEIRDAHGTSQSVAGIYMNNASECNISGNIVTDISAAGWFNDAYGIWLEDSSDNSFTSSTDVSYINTDATWGRMAYGIYIGYSNNNSFCSSTSVSYINSSTMEASGIFLDYSNNNSFNSSTDVSYVNAFFGEASGITLWGSNNNSFSSSTNVFSITASANAYGIRLRGSNNNRFGSSTSISHIDATLEAFGILLGGSNNNRFSSSTSISYVNATDLDAYGIYLWFSSDNWFSSGSISDINAPTWWDFYSEEDAHGNSARDITIRSFPTTISFTYDNGIKLKSVDTPPADPGGKRNISKYVHATKVTADSWIFMNVSYEEGDLGSVDENSLRMWKHNGTDCTLVPGTNGVNTAENYVYANITEFSVFAPLGNVTGVKLEINKTGVPDPVSPGGTLNYTIHVNNTGNATATNVTVMETYDKNVTFVAAVPVPSSDNDMWQFPTLNVSETKWINISVIVNASVPNGTVLHNTVNVTCDEGVTDSDTADTTVLFKELNCTCGDICVNETGWWRDGGAFIASGTPIQDAINNAIAGETICVKDGTYAENVDVNKRLTIRSENGAANCIVNASDSNDHVFEVGANYVNICGFTVQNATANSKAGIYLGNNIDHCNIFDNTATNNCVGIYLSTSSNNTLLNNTAYSNRWLGIWLSFSSNNTLSNNTANSNNDCGIELDSSSNNTLLNNTANSNTNRGIHLYEHSSNNELTSNTALNNDCGIRLYSASKNELTSNTALNNQAGIKVCYSRNNELMSNTANSNNDYGIYLECS